MAQKASSGNSGASGSGSGPGGGNSGKPPGPPNIGSFAPILPGPGPGLPRYNDGTIRAPISGSMATRAPIIQAREDKDIRRDQLPAALFNAVMEDQNRQGGFLICADGQPYLFDGTDKRGYRLAPNDVEFGALLAVRYGLLYTETAARHAIAALRSWAVAQGAVREVRRFTAYDTESKTLYLSRYDGSCYAVDGSGHHVVPNGAGPLFADDDKGKTCYPNIGPHGILFDRLVDDLQYVDETSGGLTPDQQRCLLGIWIFALAFPDLLPAKPLLLVEGQRGSGKTATIQRIQAALHGYPFAHSVGQNGEEDFGVTLLRSPIALIDNTDSFTEWLRDALCAYATGGGWLRRKKYTDADQVEIRPQAFVALATKNPTTFRRDDVADRTIILRLARRADKGGYTPMEMLLDGIRKDRELIYGEWLYYLNEIVAVMRKGMPAMKTKYRLADFARVAHTIGPVIGFGGKEIDGALRAAQSERDVFMVENDPTADLLDRWLENTKNTRRDVRPMELFSELSQIAEEYKVRSFVKTVNGLVTKLRSPALEKHVKIETKDGEGSGFVYRIRRA